VDFETAISLTGKYNVYKIFHKRIPYYYSSIFFCSSSWDRDQWSALVNIVMNLRVPQNIVKFLSSCAARDFSRTAQLHGII
jgi:hypothetical protein